MITDSVLKYYVKAIIGMLPVGWPVYPKGFFDQNLEFERVRENMLDKDQAFKEFTTEPNGNWVVVVYNRGPIDRSIETGRQQKAIMRAVDPDKVHEYGWSLVKTPFSIRLYSPSIPWIEAIEEHFAALPPPGSIEVPIKLPPDDQPVTLLASMDAAVPQTIVKLPEADKGSLSTLQIDVAMNYPVIVHKGTYPRITQVILDVYIGDEPDAESRILQLTAP